MGEFHIIKKKKRKNNKFVVRDGNLKAVGSSFVHLHMYLFPLEKGIFYI